MATKQIIFTRSMAIQTSSTVTNYGFVTSSDSPSTNAANIVCVWATAGTFSDLYIVAETAPGVGKSWTYTVTKNGVATSLAVTISGSSTSGSDTNPAHAFSVSPGDLIVLQHVPSGTPSGSILNTSIEFNSTNTGESGHSINTSLNTGTLYYNPLVNVTDTSGTSSNRYAPIAAAGTLTAMYLKATTTMGTKSVTLVLYKNGVKQDGSGGTVNTSLTMTGTGVSTANKTFSLSLSAGDKIALEYSTTSGTFQITSVSCGFRFVATTDGESNFAGGDRAGPNSSLTTYLWLEGYPNSAWGATESFFTGKLASFTSSFKLSNWQILLDTSPGTSKSYAFTARKNASSTGCPTCTISGASTTGTDLFNELTLASGDVFCLQEIPTGTPSTVVASWTFIQKPTTTIVPKSFPFVGLLNGNSFVGMI